MEPSVMIAGMLRSALQAGLGRCHLAVVGQPVPGAAVCRGPRIVLACQGVHRMTVAGRERPLPLRVGETLLMPDGCWNRAEPGQRRRYCSVGLQPDGLRGFLRDHDGRSLGTSPSWAQLLPRPTVDDQGLWRLALQASDAAERAALVVAILHRTLHHFDTVQAHGTAADRWRAIATWLEEQLPMLPGREATAAQVGLHPGYVSQLCREQAGCSFQDYCSRLRLGYARDLLRRHPAMSILEVALCCGYGDARYFRRMYKRCFGRPPSRERVALS